MRFRKTVILLLLVLLYSNLVVTLCFGTGQKEEDRLAQARYLITQKKYKEAKLLLSRIMIEEPNKFYEANQLMRSILTIESTYNDKLGELMTVLFEQKDVEMALKIIAELEELNPNPDVSVKETLAQAKQGALFIANENRFNDIMNSALVKLQSQDYLGAVDIYLTGFALYRQEFDAASYNAQLKQTVGTAISQVITAAGNFKSSLAGLAGVESAYRQAVSQSTGDGLVLKTREFLTYLLTLVKIQQDSASAARLLAEQNRILRTASSVASSDYFLYYAQHLLTGRANASSPEGIIVAVNLSWSVPLADVEGIIKGKAAGLVDRIEPFADELDFKNMAGPLKELKPLYASLLELAYTRYLQALLPTGYDVRDNTKLILNAGLPDFMEYQISYKQLFVYEEFGEHFKFLEELRVASQPLASLAADSLVETLKKEHIWFQNKAVEWNRLSGRLQDLGSGSVMGTARIIKLCSRGMAHYLLEYHRLSELSLAAWRQKLEVISRELYSGVQVDLDKDILQTVFDPRAVLQKLNLFQNDINTFVRGINYFLNLYPRFSDYPLKGTELDTVLNKLAALLTALNDQQQVLQDNIFYANGQIAQAERFKKEGDARYQTAKNDYTGSRYDSAREMINQARDSYLKSLTKQEDPELRRLVNLVLPELLATISQKQNEQVVVEVRSFIDRGIQSYRENQFDEAEKLLIRAKTRWEDTNPGVKNEEIDSWLNVVKEAKALQKGWVIEVTEPLYADIMQRLNLATHDYGQGMALKKAGKDQEAILAFQAAIEKLDNIKISYPLLKEANTLRLKINKELNPDEFLSGYNREKQEAKTAIRNNNTTVMREKYGILKEYQQLVTDRELAPLISDIEIALGIKKRPPSAADITASQSRTAEAQKIYAARDRDRYEEAKALLDASLELWPDNQAAKTLKDRILIAQGGKAPTDFLSVADLAKYREAERLFVERNYIGALNLVTELLKKPENSNYPPLLDLKTKIEERLKDRR